MPLLLARDLLDALLPYLPWVLVPAVVALLGAIAYLGHHEAVRLLEGLAARLQGPRLEATTGLFAFGSPLSLRGALRGHDVHVRFVHRRKGQGGYTATAFDVQVHHPAASFEVDEASGLDQLGRWLGLSAGGRLEDGLIARTRSLEGEVLLQARDVQAALRRVLALPGVDRVELKGEALYVEQRARAHVRGLEEVLEALVELARVVGRSPLPELSLRPRGGAARRFAWTGGGETARCPYCRDELDAAAPDAAACERCSTVHHRECLVEAGGCTVFGCGARDEPGRARA